MAYASPRGIARANGRCGVGSKSRRRTQQDQIEERLTRLKMASPNIAKAIAMLRATGGIFSHKQNVG